MYNNQVQQYLFHTKQAVKLMDADKKTHLFVGNGKDSDGDHTVYASPQSNFQVQNFNKRTPLVLNPTNDGFFQIFDEDKQAFFFVGNGKDSDGDRTLFAVPYKNNSEFEHRSKFTIVPSENGCVRILDKNHGCYLFVGNGKDEGGDHTVYAVSQDTFSKNSSHWAPRTLWFLEGANFLLVNTAMRLSDSDKKTFLFVGNGKDSDGDHTVYASPQNNFQTQNFAKRTPVRLIPSNNGLFQIVDEDKQAYFFVGNGTDSDGDRTVFAKPQSNWTNYNDFLKRTSFTVIPAENGKVRIIDRDHSAYLFVGNGKDEGGDHTVYGVATQTYNNNFSHWGPRTLWDISK